VTRRGCEHAIVPAPIPSIFRSPGRGLDFRPGFSEIWEPADFNALLYSLTLLEISENLFFMGSCVGCAEDPEAGGSEGAGLDLKQT